MQDIVIPDKEFDKIEFKVHRKGGTKAARKVIDEFDGLDDEAVKYICLLYDKKSPLPRFIKNLSQRKRYVAAMVGLTETAEGESLFDRCVDLTDSSIIEAILALLQRQNDKVWEQIVMLEQVYYEYIKNAIKPVSANSDKEQLMAIERKDKLTAGITRYAEQLEGLYERFFQADEKLEEEGKKELRRYSPEQIASMR